MQPMLKWLMSVLFWLAAFTAPAHESMLAVIVLVAVDLFVGIWAAKKRGEKIVSYKLRRTVTTKIFPYQVAVVCALFIEQQFFTGIPLMKAIAGFIAVAESRSIYERLGEISGLDFWSVLREYLQPKNKDA